MEIAVLSDIHGNEAVFRRCLKYTLSQGIKTFFFQIKGLPTLCICHGSPSRANEKMLPGEARTLSIMEETSVSVILCGHTHFQEKIVHQGKCVLNSGAVGLPLGSGGKAQFLILHGENGVWQEEFVSLEYDVDKAIRDMQEAGLYSYAPYWSKITEHMLKGGTISHGTVLARAMEICRETRGECHWPQIPEECWQQAIEELLTTEE